MMNLTQPLGGAGDHALSRTEQVIIAGGDEDVAARDLIDWVRPLLPGIPGGRWQVCEIEFLAGGRFAVRYQSGAPGHTAAFTAGWRPDEAARIAAHLPGASSLAIIVLEDCTGQMMSLLDSAASWLGVYDLGCDGLEPVAALLRTCAGMAVAA